MFLKQNIPKFKKVLQSVPILLTALVCALSFNTLQTHASGLSSSAQSEISRYAAALVDSIGSGSQGGTDSIKYGVSKSQTGYLCYMLTKDGATVPGTTAVALSSPGFSEYPGSTWIVTSRKGGYTAGQFSGNAPWSCTPWTDNGLSTNEPQIRAYFESVDGNGVQKAFDFVDKNWGKEVADKFGNDELILVIETIMNLQFSYSSGTNSNNGNMTLELAKMLTPITTASMQQMKKLALESGMTELFRNWPSDTNSDEAYEYYNAVKDTLVAEIKDAYYAKYPKGSSSGERQMLDTPFIGTVPNLVEVKTKYSPEPQVFDSYLNKVACFAEQIQSGQAGEKAGFIPWTGSTTSKISNSDVFNYGVAMMVISATNPLQTTADESQIPTPHPAPVESTGTFSIIKNYRTKDTTTNTLTDDGCFTTSNLSNQITIENERDYQVVGWRITDSTSTSVSSINWNPPGSVQTQGTTPTSVTIETPYKTLYLLLEKTEDPPPQEPQDYNYKLTQSSITRRINFTTPDHRLSMPHIENHNFKWIIPAHQTSCPGHTFTDACHGQHSGPHTASCPTACSSTCTKAHTHNTEGCQAPHYYDCGTRCTTQTASCSGWQWHERNLKLSINNTQQSNYPDILATKSGWNTEPQNSKLTKHYYLNDASFERTSTSSQSYSESNWDYVAVLLRGKDKLTIAHWQNAGTGSGLTTAANIDLQGVSSSGFTIANTDSGTRKTQDYMETFNAYFNTEESEGVDNYTYYKSTIHATVPAPDTPRGSTLCGINQRKAYISNPLSINGIKVRIK